MSEPVEPISDEDLDELRVEIGENPSMYKFIWPEATIAGKVPALLARLDAAEADRAATHEAYVTACAERDEAITERRTAEADRQVWKDTARGSVALVPPEGVVTLPKLGQRVRITTDGGMDHTGEVIRYGDPEGNVRTLFMVALDDGSSGYFLDDPSWHWTLVPYRPEAQP